MPEGSWRSAHRDVIGVVIRSRSHDELKKKIDRLKGRIPLELVTKNTPLPARIIETYKGFKIRKWSDNDIICYDTAYQ